MNFSKIFWQKKTNYLLLFIFYFFHLGCSLKKAPGIRFNAGMIELGSMLKGELATIKILYTNTGNADLIIRDVSVYCDCTSIKSYKRHLKPNETAELIAVFNSSKELKNNFKHSIVFITNCSPILNTVFFKGKLTNKIKAQSFLPSSYSSVK